MRFGSVMGGVTDLARRGIGRDTRAGRSLRGGQEQTDLLDNWLGESLTHDTMDRGEWVV